jgi:hypothetical protein
MNQHQLISKLIKLGVADWTEEDDNKNFKINSK